MSSPKQNVFETADEARAANLTGSSAGGRKRRVYACTVGDRTVYVVAIHANRALGFAAKHLGATARPVARTIEDQIAEMGPERRAAVIAMLQQLERESAAAANGHAEQPAANGHAKPSRPRRK